MKTILFIQHHSNPEPDAGQTHIVERGATLRRVKPYKGEDLPELGEMDGVILPGGPQMVTDLADLPYLQAEMDYVLQAAERQIPVLAICLGAQMVAHRLGASVDWHPEGAVAFGYHRIRPTAASNGMFPSDLHVLSGNAQGFDLPPGATLLAEGDLWPCQAFSYGSSLLALQFHPEVTRTILDDWQAHLGHYVGKPGADDFARQDADFIRYDTALKNWYRSLLDDFFGLGFEKRQTKKDATHNRSGVT